MIPPCHIVETEIPKLAHAYVHIYGSRHGHDVTGMPMPLRDVLHNSTYVKGQCHAVSHDFARWGQSNYPEHKYKVIHGEGPVSEPRTYPPEFNEHWAVLVNDKHVVDFTRRQFEPNASVPTIMHVNDWRMKHPVSESITEVILPMKPSHETIQVANGWDPYQILEGGFLGPLLRYAVGAAVSKGIQKGIQKGSSRVNQILSNAESEAPLQTVKKLHTLATHPGSVNTPEGQSAARHAADLARKHNISIGPNGPEINKLAVLSKAAGVAPVNKNTWGDAMKAFKSGLEGK